MPRRVLAAMAVAGALLLLPLSSGAALAEKRVALIIGNGSYQSVSPLPNPIKDANAIAAMLKNAGFDWVKMRQDVGNLDFKRALREFMDAAQDADIAVVYYAGHGIQIRDMNYMIPVDAKLATEIDAEDEAVSLDRIVMALEPAKRLRLVILDACRDNPFGRTMKRRVATRAIRSGLAKVEEPSLSETLIAFAAKGGSTAEDGDGQNSPFAAALIKHLAVPGLDIRLAFGRVRDEVLKSTANKQEPFVYGSLGGEAISLVPAPAQPKAEPIAEVRADYQLVEQVGTKKGWEIFLSSHKEGLYADLAREQLAKLTQAEQSRPPAPPAAADASKSQKIALAPVEPPSLPKPSGPSTEERRVWERIRDSGDRAKIREFIGKYPSSPLAETAKNRLDSLDRAVQERDDKARAEREAARQREEEDRLAKASDAERKRFERETAAKQREEDERRAKATEADRKKLEREAAAKQREDEERRAKAETERKNAEREAANQREEEAGRTKSAAGDGKRQDASCQRDDDRLTRLRGSISQGWAREDLKRLQQDTACDRVRSQIVALLAQPTSEMAPQPAAPQPAAPQPAAPREPLVNTPELVLSAQSELRRLGCFAGREDGNLSGATKEAIQRYFSQKGQSAKDVKVTDRFVADLKGEGQRVCPLSCSRGEHPEGDRCIANAKPEKSEKPKATVRQRDESDEPASRRRAKAKREEPRREAARPKPERAKPERAASRPAPQPAARSQASGGGGHSGGGIVGVGF